MWAAVRYGCFADSLFLRSHAHFRTSRRALVAADCEGHLGANIHPCATYRGALSVAHINVSVGTDSNTNIDLHSVTYFNSVVDTCAKSDSGTNFGVGAYGKSGSDALGNAVADLMPYRQGRRQLDGP